MERKKWQKIAQAAVIRKIQLKKLEKFAKISINVKSRCTLEC